MSTPSQIREGLRRAWDSMTEGWRELKEMAAEALTRSHPTSSLTQEDQRPARRTLRWGLLTVRLPKVEPRKRARIAVSAD
jgi:HSP20 family protein